MAEDDFFDTRNNRLARDIRNLLGKAFVKRLDPDLDLTPVEEMAREFLSKDPGPLYENYIKDRLARFHSAKNAISKQAISDDYYRALALWDQQLFFEVHEVLESLWIKATGNRKLILQALIRAAGVYIHLANHNKKGAEKMAARAKEVLEKHRGDIPTFPGLESLINCMARIDLPPPKLLS